MSGRIHIFDRDTSALMARRVRAQFRRCWLNAARAVQWLGESARYVEGWVMVNPSSPTVFEHGWCEINGKIVDPSYTPYVSTLEPPLLYYPGMRYEAPAAALALADRKLPIAWSRDDEDYRRAFESAWREAARRMPAEPLPKTKVVHCRREPSDVFIGRPSMWGSPFHLGRDGNAKETVEKFRRWLLRHPNLLNEVRALRGKVLGCDCPPEPCHGDVLAELADLGYETLGERPSADGVDGRPVCGSGGSPFRSAEGLG